MSDDSSEIVHQLLEDVSVLDQQFLGGLVRPSPEISRTVLSPILRRWICEQTFHRVQRLLGQTHMVRFEVWDEDDAIAHCQKRHFNTWMAMASLGPFIFGMGNARDEFVKPDGTWTFSVRGEKSKRVRRPSRLFFEQQVFYWKDRLYRRHDIVSFQANKRGGVHYDSRRKDDESNLDDLARSVGFEIVGTHHQMLVGDAPIRGKGRHNPQAQNL